MRGLYINPDVFFDLRFVEPADALDHPADDRALGGHDRAVPIRRGLWQRIPALGRRGRVSLNYLLSGIPNYHYKASIKPYGEIVDKDLI